MLSHVQTSDCVKRSEIESFLTRGVFACVNMVYATTFYAANCTGLNKPLSRKLWFHLFQQKRVLKSPEVPYLKLKRWLAKAAKKGTTKTLLQSSSCRFVQNKPWKVQSRRRQSSICCRIFFDLHKRRRFSRLVGSFHSNTRSPCGAPQSLMKSFPPPPVVDGIKLFLEEF